MSDSNANSARIRQAELFDTLPPEWPDDPLPAIQSMLQETRQKVVVLDDDPTGTQTVHGVPVLTEWSVEILRQELANDLPAFYLLTNSRSLPLPEAQALNREIGRNLAEAARQANASDRFMVVSRSDSTLRGHFPGEVEALAETLTQDFDGWLVIPFFLEGGRYTINDVHYVAEGEWLTPAGETEFARDAAFGYRASNLRHWVEEKMQRRVSADEVASISIDDIRQGGPERVAELLGRLSNGQVCVVNAASMRDMATFTQGLMISERSGKRFVYRTAASFVQTRAGLRPRALLTKADLNVPESGGGLLVVGSYVPRSTQQVTALLAEPDIASLEIDVEALLDEGRQSTIEQTAAQADQALSRGQDVVLFTSRRLITGADARSSLSIGQQVSSGLVAIVQTISTRPRYLLAKGGITSSDVATTGLGVKRAMVLGQILPGVPLWELGAESRHPRLPYIVFPGNVGDSQALVEIVRGFKSG